jgi:hypothetical protein
MVRRGHSRLKPLDDGRFTLVDTPDMNGSTERANRIRAEIRAEQINAKKGQRQPTFELDKWENVARAYMAKTGCKAGTAAKHISDQYPVSFDSLKGRLYRRQ